jgi:tRNA(Ile)-lysidine synthase
LIAKVAAALGRARIRSGELILVGLSGGPDSVALLHVLLALRPRFGYRLAAAHFNHRIRGVESDRDESFARELCKQFGVELIVGHAERLGRGAGNLEERAREERLAFLRREGERLGAERVALGHHAGDQAETVLLRLIRGAGAAGLGAMAEVGPGPVFRPLLAVERAEILKYLEAIHARFVVDSSNASPAMLRNRVRAQLLPMLEREYGAGLGRRLAGLAAEMRSLDDLVTAMAEAELERAIDSDGTLDVARAASLHPAVAAAVVREFVRRRVGDLRRVGRAHIDAVVRLCLEGPPNGAIDLPGGWRAERNYATLAMRKGSRRIAPRFKAKLAAQGTTIVGDFVFQASIVPPDDAPKRDPARLESRFDADCLASGLVARNFEPGDRIRPLGMRGTRKVKDVFIDRKVPRELRARLPIVTLDGAVLWIPGLIRARDALVTSETRRVLRLTASPRAELATPLREIKHA